MMMECVRYPQTRPSVTEPDAVCLCDGVLADGVHVDACRLCAGMHPQLWAYCPERDRHVNCGVPEAVQCAHLQCIRVAALELVGDAPCGLPACCGCCEPW